MYASAKVDTPELRCWCQKYSTARARPATLVASLSNLHDSDLKMPVELGVPIKQIDWSFGRCKLEGREQPGPKADGAARLP
eukprot:CAMPEP_0115380790 /NCGR_PEP_ID=MMETSP0271-20121206/5232_1 /TAXON_ID=71861 /ORGANISM="Scrippsiella trochoidea, Strain CCMP3099" /LENGTH=80 /DNA_ID=CAMNT_0002804041 /DNA_START=405 /DNA_END=647 /DNA_ORIENTATION=+